MKNKLFLKAIQLCLFVLVVTVGTASTQATGHKPPYKDTMKRSHQQSIPRLKYKTWSLFLVCNPQWLAANKSSDLLDLYDEFESFGEAIGNDNLALWFWRPHDDVRRTGNVDNTTLKQDIVDLERSIKFCKAYRLKPSDGPHLVVTSMYPDEKDLPNVLPADSAVFALGNMQPKEISGLLAHLADELLEKDAVPKNTAQKVATSEKAESAKLSTPASGKWVSLMEAVQGTLNSFGCAWTFKLDAGGVKADLHACST